MTRLVVVILSKHELEVTRIPFMSFDRVHTDGSITLSPVSFKKAPHTIPADRVVGWEVRHL